MGRMNFLRKLWNRQAESVQDESILEWLFHRAAVGDISNENVPKYYALYQERKFAGLAPPSLTEFHKRVRKKAA